MAMLAQILQRELAPELVQRMLRDSVPVVALIQVAAARYHYVVIVGWGAEQVVYHDPAVAPFAALKVREFLKRWQGADAWAMIMRPSPTAAKVAAPPADSPPPGPVDSMPCRPWLDEAADAADSNRLEDADHFLAAAAMACPSEPLVLRELAGVRFRQGRRAEAMRLADEYLRRVPGDAIGWQLLASSRYLTGDVTGALTAWNTIGRPAVDLVRVEGARHIRFRTLAHAMTISAGVVLTPARFALAQRRITDIPALAAARVSYTAVPGGVVEVRADVVEHPVVEPIPRLLVRGGLHAVVHRDVGLTVNSPLGAGEQWTLQWRWEAADPRQALRLDIPARVGLPGTLGLESSWQRYRFSAGIPDAERRATTLGFNTWVRSGLEAMVATRFERWSGPGDFFAFSFGSAVHGWHDRVALIAQGEQAVALNGQASYGRIATRVAWAPPVGRSAIAWTMRAGADWTSASTPVGLQPIAGGDLSRDIPLRAHSRIVGGFLPAIQTGQGVVHGGIAGNRPFASMGPIVLGVGVFLDAADVENSVADPAGSRWYLDGGAGLRIGLTGWQSGALRLDLARGLLTDRRWGLSVGLEQSWPPRLHGLQ